jgi:hypothetical protein
MFKSNSLYQCQNFRDVLGGFYRIFDFYQRVQIVNFVHPGHQSVDVAGEFKGDGRNFFCLDFS